MIRSPRPDARSTPASLDVLRVLGPPRRLATLPGSGGCVCPRSPAAGGSSGGAAGSCSLHSESALLLRCPSLVRLELLLSMAHGCGEGA